MSYADARQNERKRIEELTRVKNEKAQSSYFKRCEDERIVTALKREWENIERESGKTYDAMTVDGNTYHREEVLGVAVPWIEEDVAIQNIHQKQNGRIRELENQLREMQNNIAALTARTNTMVPNLTQCTIDKLSAEVDVTAIHRSINWSNRYILCGLTGNVVMGPVAGYLTSNVYILVVIELFALAIAVLGIIIRPDKKEVVTAEKEKIKTNELYSVAVNRDVERQIAS